MYDERFFNIRIILPPLDGDTNDIVYEEQLAIPAHAFPDRCVNRYQEILSADFERDVHVEIVQQPLGPVNFVQALTNYLMCEEEDIDWESLQKMETCRICGDPIPTKQNDGSGICSQDCEKVYQVRGY